MYICVKLAIQIHLVLKAPPQVQAANKHNEIGVTLANSRVRGDSLVPRSSVVAEQVDCRIGPCFATRMQKVLAGGGGY